MRLFHCVVLLPFCAIVAGCSSERSPRRSGPTRGVATPTTSARAASRTAPGTRDDTASVRVFVQSFYDWYLPASRKADGSPAWYRVLRSRDSVLTAELALGLRTDSTVQAGLSGEVTNLNFDPFLASQDPCARYEVKSVTPSAAAFGVVVHAMCGPGSDMPDVHLDVVRRNGSWQFSNFHYDGSDLRALLCETATDAADRRPVAAELHCPAPTGPATRS